MARRRQRADEPNLFALRCSACGQQLVRTASGYLSCPEGHGKLRLDEDRPEEPEPWGLWFGPDDPAAE
jgi:hypothetical protein